MRRSLPLSLLVASACGADPVSLGFDTDLDFTISVDPATLDVETGPEGAEPIPFTATASFSDGTTTPLDVVAWSLSNRSVGTLDEDGLFTPSDRTGGVTWITAELDGLLGRAEVHVRFHDEQILGAVDPAAFDAATPEPVTGTWLYPADGVNVPRNTPALRLMWNASAGGVYRVAFRSASTDLVWYTDQPELLLDGDTWSRIAATNAGGEVQVTLSVAVDGRVLEEPPRTVTVNRLDATGSIVYWTTTAAVDGGGTSGGLMRIPFGSDAVPFYTPQNNGGHCVGCHTSSPNGDIAFTWDGGNGPIGVVRSDGTPVVGYPTEGQVDVPRANFTTFSPDSRYVLGALSGDLVLYDAATGATIKTLYQGDDATHPAWSPDGTKVAVTLTTGHVNDWHLPSVSDDARIVVFPVSWDTDGTPRLADWKVLVDPSGAKKAYYPTWSPDGRWLAFNESEGDMNNDPDAELWVIDGEGERAAVRLDAANGEGQLTNSWPRWAPLPDDEVLWLAFGSTRDYGNRVSGRPQVWVAAFDPKKARDGVDPSWAAFWLPGQAEASNNHIPVWVK